MAFNSCINCCFIRGRKGSQYLQKWRFMVVLGFNPEKHDSIPKGNPADSDGDRQHRHLTHSLLTKTSSTPLFSPTAWRGRRLCPHRPEIIASIRRGGARPGCREQSQPGWVGELHHRYQCSSHLSLQMAIFLPLGITNCSLPVVITDQSSFGSLQSA
jgi:hypothetical protein